LDNIKDHHLVAGVLKQYFRDMVNPIFPKTIGRDLVSYCSVGSQSQRCQLCKELLQKNVSYEARNTLSYLFGFLYRVKLNSSENKMTETNLGICWGPTLFKAGASAGVLVASLLKDFEFIFPL
jgi:hypothetical protein